MGIPRALEENKTLVERFETPGVGIFKIAPHTFVISKTFPGQKKVKTPQQKQKTTIYIKEINTIKVVTLQNSPAMLRLVLMYE